MTPSIGCIVHYMLSADDARRITTRRKAAHAGEGGGNFVDEGQVYPMLIVRVWGETEQASVNGQVFLDGDDTLWVTSVGQGDGPRQWHEAPRVP